MGVVTRKTIITKGNQRLALRSPPVDPPWMNMKVAYCTDLPSTREERERGLVHSGEPEESQQYICRSI
jgi:hypothetical protein